MLSMCLILPFSWNINRL